MGPSTSQPAPPPMTLRERKKMHEDALKYDNSNVKLSTDKPTPAPKVVAPTPAPKADPDDLLSPAAIEAAYQKRKAAKKEADKDKWFWQR